MENRSALVAGASGLVGSQLLDVLLKGSFYDEVYVLSRRPLKIRHPKMKELIIDFDELPQMTDFPQVQDVYCCLGTTMKKAGSKEAFRKVDYRYPLELAENAAEKGAAQYLLVSAMGADKNSFIFYNRVKGEVEEAISKLSSYKQIAIFRPSLLLGERQEARRGEGTAKLLMRLFKPLLIGPLRKYRGIHARTVANGMYHVARQDLRGVQIYDSGEIKPLAAEVSVSQKL